MPPTARKAPAKKAPAKKAPAKKAAPPKKAVANTQAPVKASARALSSFHERFEKRFGAGTIAKATKRAYQVVSTGSITLDLAMGCGGWVVGRIAEVWGPESVSKTTLALIGIGNFQRAFPDRRAALIDMERSFDADWAERQGVDLDRFDVLKPRTSEDVSDMARMLIETGMYSIVVLDSVGGMITREEMVNDAEKASVGTAAKVITRMVKQCAVLCDDTETALIIINQVRSIISHQGGDTTGGGKALRHVTTHKIRLKRTGDDPYYVGTGENQELVGFVVGAVVEKNKVAPPRRVANFALFNQDTAEYGPLGIDRAREAFTLGKRFGLIEEVSVGRFLVPGEEKPIHGMPKTIVFLREHPEALDKVRRDMLTKLAEQTEVKDTVEIDTVVEVDPESEHGDDEPDTVLDFSGRTKMRDADSRALDQMGDDERMAALASAQ